MQRHLGLLVFSGELIADKIPVGDWSKSEITGMPFGGSYCCAWKMTLLARVLRQSLTKSQKEVFVGRAGASLMITIWLRKDLDLTILYSMFR
jgi:hypothetical protein